MTWAGAVAGALLHESAMSCPQFFEVSYRLKP